MVKILIVDDEKIERNGIRFLLNHQGIEAELYEETNGVKALEFLAHHRADILLTDIKMPFMDGLTLIKEVSAKYPEMKIIIFSGYGEFEYAKQAMKYNVNNYILKPVDPKEFENTIGQVLKELESEKLDKELKEESRQFVKEHILLSIMNGADSKKWEEKQEKLFLDDFLETYRCMILVEFDREFFGKKQMNFVDELTKKCSFTFQYLNLNQHQCVLLFEQQERFSRNEAANEIQKIITEKFQEDCYLAVGKYEKEKMDLKVCYDRLEELMENKFYLLDSKIFYENDGEESTDTLAIEEDTYMKQIKQDIKMKDMVGLRQHYDALCEKYKGKKVFSQMYVKFVFSNLMKDIYEMLPDKDIAFLNTAVDKLYRAVDFTQVMEILEVGIRELEDAFSINPQMVHREIETVKQYIYNNYDKELSVDMLAEQVFMAPSYLSHIFKKETGQNLSKFIKTLRMEKAREMLTNTHNKIVNISYAVGYPNVSYFCQSFREYFGISPQKYRNQGEKNEES